GPPVLDRHDDDAVLLLEERVHHDHPPPWPGHEPEPIPAADELWTDTRQARKHLERTPELRLRIAGKAVRTDQTFQILDRDRAEFNERQRLKIVQRDGLPRPCPLESFASPLEGARDPIEEVDHVPRVDIRFVQRLGEE